VIQARRQLPPPGAALLFPVGLLILVLVLGLLGLNGSSIGVYATDNGLTERQAQVLAGPSRAIRSDEWAVRTPWVLGQAERGLPHEYAGAVGRHDAAILSDVPTRGWEVLLRPHTAPYHILDSERAFALEWWAFFAIQLLGVYALLLVLTRRIAVSALAACLFTLSPVTQWWTIPFTFTTVGYGCLATALVLAAYRASTGRRRVGLSVMGGFVLAAFLAGLYPPWQIGTALVVLPVGMASVLPDLWRRDSRRRAVRSLGIVLSLALGIGGGLFAAFLAGHADAVHELADTVYPGQRTASMGGGTNPRIALSAAFDYFATKKPYTLVNGTNQSENSSVLPLLLPVGVAGVGLVARRRLTGSRAAPALVGCLLGGVVIAVWMFLPIPVAAGRLLLLTRVPPSRLLPSLGLAGVLSLALLAGHRHESGRRLSRWHILAATTSFGAVLGWSAKEYRVEGARVDLRLAVAFALIAVVGLVVSLGRRPAIGLLVLVLFSFWQTSLINPVRHGLGPLTESPLRRAVESLKRGAPTDAGWIAFVADATVKGTLSAAGVNNISGVSPYPDRAAWEILDPAGANEDIWNRYAHISFAPGIPGAAPTFTLRAPDDVLIIIDPCARELRELGARFVVTQGFEVGTCVRPLVRLPYGESFVVVYDYTT